MPDGSDIRRIRAIIHGRVQGVNFRAATQRKALELGLTGWVRNRSDGAVETVAQGPSSGIASFVEFLRHGPPTARVSSVDLDWEAPGTDFVRFEVRYTG